MRTFSETNHSLPYLENGRKSPQGRKRKGVRPSCASNKGTAMYFLLLLLVPAAAFVAGMLRAAAVPTPPVPEKRLARRAPQYAAPELVGSTF